MGLFDFLKDKTLKTDLVIQHPRLGRLTYQEEGWWEGQTSVDDYVIEFSINGNENGLDNGLDEICIQVTDGFSEFHEKAITLLNQTVLAYKIPVSLNFVPFEILWIWKESNKEGFTIRFNDNSDPNKLWRVAFENGEAINCGYDG